ncbi:ATP-dependent sacrificial sulfur transferase LarE [Candidatus Aerophobetes bacterium]|nr:ATP-dependent sacrificial sulfur transferase LarE [Candidatus Aerophobetes bacterium]
MKDLKRKIDKLKNILLEMQSVLVAYSGGVDSTFLLKIAKDTLKEKVIAVTATSPTYPEDEIKQAEKIAKMLGVKHILVESRELENPNFRENPPQRCYWCKKELFSLLLDIARKNKINYVIDGSNADDTRDFRPGKIAAKELGVRSPLEEVSLTKNEIRLLSKKMHLPTWNKPSLACLSSRFPYGTRITEEELEKVAKAESFLRKEGFIQVRVRHHDRMARIEVFPDEIKKIIDDKLREKIVKKFKELGYTYITVDLEGYRQGSMNETLDEVKFNLPYRD